MSARATLAALLPEGVKRWARALPQWCPIGLAVPQDVAEIRMTSAGREVDVTRNAVVAALRPLTLAVGLDEQTMSIVRDSAAPRLVFLDLVSRRTVGMLQLRHVASWDTQVWNLGLFEVSRAEQRCLRWPYRSWNSWLQNRAIRKSNKPGNFWMPPEAVQQLMIFYICPRQVVLVSVEDGEHSNLFPMDLIGPVSSGHFTLALRSTSQSVAAMQRARRAALSDIAASERAIAYQLGAHHKNVKVDWDRLPFAIQRSRIFSLPCPLIALRVREVEILESRSIGSHTFFVTRLVSEHAFADAVRLCHTSGIYQYFRARHGHPLQRAG